MLFYINISFRNIPTENRYVLLSDSWGEKNPKSAIYKRYLSVIYIRVSPVYEGYECIITAVNEYNKLIKLK